MRRSCFLLASTQNRRFASKAIPAAFNASSAVSCARCRLIVAGRSGIDALLAVYFPHNRREGRAAIPFRRSDRLTVVVCIEDDRMLGTRHIDLPDTTEGAPGRESSRESTPRFRSSAASRSALRFRFPGSAATFGIDSNSLNCCTSFRPMCRGVLAGRLRRRLRRNRGCRQKRNAAR